MINRDEYNILFHRAGLNRVAFKRLMDCDEELVQFINTIMRDAVRQENEACAKVCEEWGIYEAGECAAMIRERVR